MSQPIENHQITLQQASSLTATYRALPAVSLIAALQGIKAQSLPVSAINSVISQPGVVSIRIYFGAELLPPSFKLIIVGVDANGDDITSGIIVDRAYMCPPVCGQPNVLNGITRASL